MSCAAGLIGAFSGPVVYEKHQVMITAVFPAKIMTCMIDETAKGDLMNELDGLTCSDM